MSNLFFTTVLQLAVYLQDNQLLTFYPLRIEVHDRALARGDPLTYTLDSHLDIGIGTNLALGNRYANTTSYSGNTLGNSRSLLTVICTTLSLAATIS